MRILSPTSNAPRSDPVQNRTNNADSMINESAEITRTANPGIPVPSKIPTVELDTDVVSDYMAARLCVSYLGHVLFLKNQVPFPIVQLARMPTGDNTTRASKKRHELLNSFDTLASHLYTTFIALSTALALRGSPGNAGSEGEAALYQQKHGIARAFFAVALGSTVGTAKSRVIVGIDGLETKVWGLQKDGTPEDAIRASETSEEDDSATESSNSTEDDGEDESEDEESGESGQEEDEDTSGYEDDVTSPPPSRSPSPSSDSDSPPTGPTTLPTKSPLMRAEDPETVRAAERLLSRTLASACAEDDGQGLASEMAPTQIHVLLRAPRRFNHPSWIPRQNLCASMDGYLAQFLVESGQTPAHRGTPVKKRTKANKVQGVWVRSRGSDARTEDSEEDLAEEDELIWWSWDGKLIGFADW